MYVPTNTRFAINYFTIIRIGDYGGNARLLEGKIFFFFLFF
jgi:hypothetical protein